MPCLSARLAEASLMSIVQEFRYALVGTGESRIQEMVQICMRQCAVNGAGFSGQS